MCIWFERYQKWKFVFRTGLYLRLNQVGYKWKKKLKITAKRYFSWEIVVCPKKGTICEIRRPQCSLTTWELRPASLVNCFPQRWHRKGLIFPCTDLTWRLRFEARVNFLWHLRQEHAKVFLSSSGRCMCKCSASLSGLAYSAEHLAPRPVSICFFVQFLRTPE